MKYYILKELVSFLKKNLTNIKLAKRVSNNTIKLEFNSLNTIYFDLSKGNSLVYKKNNHETNVKNYGAPFDTILQKRFNNSKVFDVVLHNDDKVIRFYVKSKSSYKEQTTILQLEFTGKHTNIVILDENEFILEALRHVDEFSSSRVIKVGEKLSEIPKQSFIPKIEKIENLENLLYEIYSKKEEAELNNLKKIKISSLRKNEKKLNNLLKKLPKKEELKKLSEELYEKASLIFSNIHLIKPYDKTIKVFNYEGKEVELSLELKGSVSSYGNDLFKKAKKAKQKSEFISLEKDNLEQKACFYQRMIKSIQNATTIDECEFLAPKKQKNQTKTKKAQPYESFFFNGFKIMLGSDERSNIFLLKNAKASDFWFHLKDKHSSHVIVQNTKKTIPFDVIEKAAMLCAKFSTDYEGNYLVDFTQRRNVKIQSGANVLYNPYDTIKVNI